MICPNPHCKMEHNPGDPVRGFFQYTTEVHDTAPWWARAVRRLPITRNREALHTRWLVECDPPQDDDLRQLAEQALWTLTGDHGGVAVQVQSVEPIPVKPIPVDLALSGPVGIKGFYVTAVVVDAALS